jgi:hypothetical protein
MKTLKSSDLNMMVLNTMNNTLNYAAVRLSTPISTSAIWGFDAFPGASSAIWGTLGASAQRTSPSTAIWGTCPFRAPVQQSAAGQHSGNECLS